MFACCVQNNETVPELYQIILHLLYAELNNLESIVKVEHRREYISHPVVHSAFILMKDLELVIVGSFFTLVSECILASF